MRARPKAASASPVDVAIVGGGIIGAGIARDAARRGLLVALFEQHDFGSGTTAGSTRLIHGGLRYLQQFDLRLVRLDLRERQTLLRIAPHLVRPLPFLLPFYRASAFQRAKIRLGLRFYDALSAGSRLPRSRGFSRDEIAAAEPSLSLQGLQGAAGYFDAQAPMPERLCLENVLDARAHGAHVFNYAEVVGAIIEQHGVVGLHIRDALTGDEVEVRARVVVNAAGPWLDRVARRIESNAPPRLRTTRGIHIAVPPLTTSALSIDSPVDGRLVFVIPWLGHGWIGTTDVDDSEDPAHARATAADVDYLLRSLRPILPALDIAEIRFANVGIRALVAKPGHPSAVSRLHRIIDGRESGSPGLLSVVGGKLTGYRAIAEDVTDRLCRILNHRRTCTTATDPLPGALDAGGERFDAPVALVDHLMSLYGTRARNVLSLAENDPALGRSLAPGGNDIAAQVVFAVRDELCERVTDFVWRRSRLGFSIDQGASAVEAIAAIMARELEWSDRRRIEELERYRQTVAATQAFREDPVKSG
jgi:glycerol-3-phosphate dehydrogenase